MPKQSRSIDSNDRRRATLIAAGLFIFTLILYAQAVTFTFSNYDDNDYVTENPMVQRGLGFDAVTWAMTSGYATHWHPLTWLSHALDCTVYGLSPGGHHFSSVLLHALNAMMLFLALRKLTGETTLSACVALLFAVHPMNVQSVAWIAERKNVLSTFFGLACLYAYARYAARPTVSQYLVVTFWLVLSLMSKAMLVTMPFALLLLDWWPLQRIQAGDARTLMKTIRRPALEKIPLLAVVGLTSFVAYAAMRASNTLGESESYSLGIRVENAIVAYATYALKMFAPFNLAPFYPHPLGAIAAWKVGGSLLFLAAMTAAAVWFRTRAPYVTIGWLWFLGTLVPVIGVVQAGEQAMGDRYAYVPYVGLFVAAVWGARALAKRYAIPGRAVQAAYMAAVLLLAVRTLNESRNWHDNVALWSHAVAVTDNNYIAHQNLGVALRRMKRDDEALEQFKAALQIRPNHARSLVNIGTLLLDKKRVDEALPYLQSAVDAKPTDPMAQISLGMGYAQQGKMNPAIEHMKVGLQLNPADYRVANLLGTLYAKAGDIANAEQCFREALRIKPDYEMAQSNLQKLAKRKLPAS